VLPDEQLDVAVVRHRRAIDKEDDVQNDQSPDGRRHHELPVGMQQTYHRRLMRSSSDWKKRCQRMVSLGLQQNHVVM